MGVLLLATPLSYVTIYGCIDIFFGSSGMSIQAAFTVYIYIYFQKNIINLYELFINITIIKVLYWCYSITSFKGSYDICNINRFVHVFHRKYSDLIRVSFLFYLFNKICNTMLNII